MSHRPANQNLAALLWALGFHWNKRRGVWQQPSSIFVDTRGFAAEADILKKRLSEIHPGADHAAKYQQTVLEILNFLFNPELIDGELEVRTIDGTERKRDIIFTNDSDSTFWNYTRQSIRRST